MYTGPEFLLYQRYAQVLNTLFVCLLFSSGMPLLVPICFLTFFFYYWVDKFALLRFYSLPPRLDATLARAVGNVLEYSVFLHLLFGMWMMSNEVRMGEERSDEFARPSQTNPLTQPYCPRFDLRRNFSRPRT
jgi:hypothetical protein